MFDLCLAVLGIVVCVALIYGAGCFAVWRGGVCAVILVGACLLVFGLTWCV